MSMADVTNAEIAGGMYGPNQFSSFPGKLTLPGYVGTPTDAQGKPIAPPPGGMTLNSTPAAPAASSGGYHITGPGDFSALAPQAPAGRDPDSWANEWGLGNPYASLNVVPNSGAAAPSAPSSSAGAPAGSTDFNSALSMLANPGHVTTPGANVPQTAPTANQPDVLSHFLASQSGGQGAGGYSNKGFFDTLNALKSGGSPPTSSSLAPDPGSSLSSSMAPVSAPGGGGAPYIAGSPSSGAAPTDFTPNQFSPQTMSLLQAAGIKAPSAPAAPAMPAAVGGLGGLGGVPVMTRGLGDPYPQRQQQQSQSWAGMGSGNGGAAGNGSSGGQ